MPSEKEPWFVVDRSEALAGLLLTSRKDVAVRWEKKNDDGVDFLLAVNEGDAPPTRLFVVHVKGTTSSDKSEWMKGAKELFLPTANAVYLPVCVVVVNVRDNRALYAWAAEPLIEDTGAKLRFHPPGEFRDLNPPAVDEIVSCVNAWYDALPRQLMPAAS